MLVLETNPWVSIFNLNSTKGKINKTKIFTQEIKKFRSFTFLKNLINMVSFNTEVENHWLLLKNNTILKTSIFSSALFTGI